MTRNKCDDDPFVCPKCDDLGLYINDTGMAAFCSCPVGEGRRAGWMKSCKAIREEHEKIRQKKQRQRDYKSNAAGERMREPGEDDE